MIQFRSTSKFLQLLFVSATLIFSLENTYAAQIQRLGFMDGGDRSKGNGISGDGSTVIGSATNSAGNNRAFVWTAGEGMRDLENPTGGEFNTHAFSISRDGSVIVGSSDNQAFRWTSESGIVELEGLAGQTSYSGDVSGDGKVVIGRSSETGAFRWTQETGAISISSQTPGVTTLAHATSFDGSVIVGELIDGPVNSTDFRWTEATGFESVGDLPGGGLFSRSYDVSDDGSAIVGMSSFDSGTYRGSAPFRWTEETGVIDLGTLHEEIFSFGSGTSISGDGSVVGGFSENEDGIHEAFLWTEETGLMSRAIARRFNGSIVA